MEYEFFVAGIVVGYLVLVAIMRAVVATRFREDHDRVIQICASKNEYVSQAWEGGQQKRVEGCLDPTTRKSTTTN